MKVSGALKRLINKINSGVLVVKEQHPQIYEKAIEKIDKKKALKASRSNNENK